MTLRKSTSTAVSLVSSVTQAKLFVREYVLVNVLSQVIFFLCLTSLAYIYLR